MTMRSGRKSSALASRRKTEMSQTKTATATYTVVDIENVVRRVKADLVMIADSTQGWTADKARDYAHDVEVLAKAGPLLGVNLAVDVAVPLRA